MVLRSPATRASAALGLALALSSPGASAALDEATAPTHARAALFPSPQAMLLTDQLAKSARLNVLFHPEIGRCEPQQIAVILALRRLTEGHSDINVVTVSPKAAAGHPTLFGEPLPGRLLVVENATYASEGRISPRPRLEVWSGDGRLLLLRSIPPVVTEEGIYQDLLWSLAFTRPVDE